MSSKKAVGMKKGLSLKTTTALIVIMLLLGTGGTLFYYAFYKVVFMKIYDIEIKVVEGRHVGFNADPSLHFGMIPSMGGSAEKELNMLNNENIPVMVQVRVSGDASPYISVEDNNFVLNPSEGRKLKVYAIIPDNFNKVANFTGEAKVIYTRT